MLLKDDDSSALKPKSMTVVLVRKVQRQTNDFSIAIDSIAYGMNLIGSFLDPVNDVFLGRMPV